MTESAISIAAHISGKEVKVTKDSAGVSVLSTESGAVTSTKSILQHIAKANPSSLLYGSGAAESDNINKMLDFSSELAKENNKGALIKMNEMLSSSTFIASERLSIADILLSCTSYKFFSTLNQEERSKIPHFTRWFLTCVHQPAFRSVLGEVSSSVLLGPVSMPSEKEKKETPQSPIKAAAAKTSTNVFRPSIVPAMNRDPEFQSVAHVSNLEAGVSMKGQNFLYKRLRTRVKEILCRSDEGVGLIGSKIQVAGWTRTVRLQGGGEFAFVSLTDGSTNKDLQIIVTKDAPGFDAINSTSSAGSSLRCVGIVQAAPEGADKQKVELKAIHLEVLGTTVGEKYPLAKKRHTIEYLRTIFHLRPRTYFIGAVSRVRSACAFATHQFFNQRGFQYIHTPIVTGADCEGAGEMFGVSTMLNDKKAAIPRLKDGSIDFSGDFFGKQAYLTVSGQLNVEAFACALSDVYTFGPTFRAENSNTRRHLAEFWMIEPEICFASLEDDMNLAEDYVKFCVSYVLDHCYDDLLFFDERVEKGLIDRLKNVIAAPFQRITYTEAIELLLTNPLAKEKKWEFGVEWGCDLASEHERFICEEIYKKPTIVTNYPKDIKAFYMKMNPDNKTVAAMDILVPGIGELIGGSQREDDLEKMEARMKEMKIDEEGLQWYLDLRRYGSVPHAGFGLGFERLVLFCTGVDNIRDVIPYPRWPNNAMY